MPRYKRENLRFRVSSAHDYIDCIVDDVPFIPNDLLKAVDHAGVVILPRYWDCPLDLPNHLITMHILIRHSRLCSHTLVLTTSVGYMTRISVTPATAPAMNW